MGGEVPPMFYIIFLFVLIFPSACESHDKLLTEKEALAILTEEAQDNISFPLSNKKVVGPLWVQSESFKTYGSTKAIMKARIRIGITEGRLNRARAEVCPVTVTFTPNLVVWRITSVKFDTCDTLDPT